MPRKVTKSYQPYIVIFMSFKDKVNYDKDAMFTDAQLYPITPNLVAHGMYLKVYGVEDPGEDDEPTLFCSGTLAVCKTTVFHFMPNKSARNKEAGYGNLTISSEVRQAV